MSATLSIITNVAPIFFSLPDYIYLNIIGTFLVSYFLGPIIGAIYAGSLNVLLNNLGMGIGVIPHVILTQIIESIVIGFGGRIELKKGNELIKILVISIVLSVTVKPISIVLYYVFNPEDKTNIKSILEMFSHYYSTGIITNLKIYLISFFTGYFVHFIIKKNIINKKKD